MKLIEHPNGLKSKRGWTHNRREIRGLDPERVVKAERKREADNQKAAQLLREQATKDKATYEAVESVRKHLQQQNAQL